MRFGIFDNFGALNSVPVFQALRRGLDRLGLQHRPHDESADIAVIWSVLWTGRMRQNQTVWNHFRSSGRPVLIMEVGSLRRGHTWRMSMNGTTAAACWGQGLDPTRPEKLGLVLQPWRKSGDHVVIACQRSDSNQWINMPPVQQWLEKTIQQLKAHTDRPIRVRSHPRQRISPIKDVQMEIPKKIDLSYDDFDWGQSIHNAWCVVNWNSGPGVQAVMAGVPALVGSDNLASRVGTTDLSAVINPPTPDRREWLEWISHTEWTTEEIASGYPVSRLLLDL